jgi:hypothetical protein
MDIRCKPGRALSPTQYDLFYLALSHISTDLTPEDLATISQNMRKKYVGEK